MFFRYHAQGRIIDLAWVIETDTKRTFESNEDAYRVFRKMLESGQLPNDWNQLLKLASKTDERLRELAAPKV